MNLFRSNQKHIENVVSAASLPPFADWWPLLPILLFSILIRIGYLPVTRGIFEWIHMGPWADGLLKNGLFQYYNPAIPYPIYSPLLTVIALIQSWRGLSVSANDPSNYILLRLLPMSFELFLITVTYIWLRRERYYRWLIPLALSIAPTVIINGTLGGQVDILIVTFSVLSLLALQQKKANIAWAFFALGMLVKLQAIIIFPLLFILTFRRCGWRKLLIGIAVGALVGGAYLLPYILGMGLQKALAPYLLTVSAYNSAQVWSLNFWAAVTPQAPGIPLAPMEIWIKDSTPLFGPLSYKAVGLLLFGLNTLLVCATAWKNFEKNREFVWATAIYLGFFVFPTAIWGRYIFVAVVLCIVAIYQDRRLWPVACGLVYTSSYNMLWWFGGNWLGWLPWSRNVSTLIPWLNLGMMFVVIWIVVSPSRDQNTSRQTTWESAIFDYIFGAIRLVTAGLGVIVAFIVIRDALTYYPMATWLTQNVASKSQLVSENLEVTQFTGAQSDDARAWNWYLTPIVDGAQLHQWSQHGTYYVVLDEEASPQAFTARLARYVKLGATLLYQTNTVFPGIPRQAVLWTFQPSNVSTDTFDQRIKLLGYDLVSKSGSVLLRLYWQAIQVPDIPYHIYIHIWDSQDGQLLAQADTQLGSDTSPANTWTKGQLTIQEITLPPDAFQETQNQMRLDLGLYSLSTGARAAVTDTSGIASGDHIEIKIGHDDQGQVSTKETVF